MVTALRSASIQAQHSAVAPTTLARVIGPGLRVAVAGIGAGDIVSLTMAASADGLQLLVSWCSLRVQNETIARGQLRRPLG